MRNVSPTHRKEHRATPDGPTADSGGPVCVEMHGVSLEMRISHGDMHLGGSLVFPCMVSSILMCTLDVARGQTFD